MYSPDTNILPDFASRTNANMSLPSFTSGKVRLALLEAKKSNACGPDGCPSLLLSMFPELCLPLANLFNMSLLQETVPNEWKLAHVIPVYKGKGAKTAVENYRPISLTNNFCKIMEKLIKIKMIDYLNSNALLSPAQSGFTAGRSTLSQLLLAQHVLVDSFNDRACVDVLFTDLSKAFDSIAHNKLILKLSAYGLHPSVCGWIKSFLSYRKQRVVVNGNLSTWLSCPSGVPQGSVLGPFLFNLYVNDMPDKLLNSSIFLYADDAKLLKRIDCRLDCILFQRDIDALSAWCNIWQLRLNISKCMCVRYGLVDRPRFTYSIAGVVLQNVFSANDLGVLFDSKLTFSEPRSTF